MPAHLTRMTAVNRTNGVPAGVPAGGEFSTSVKPEAEVRLDQVESWTRAFPQHSPAASVREFRDSPTNTWAESDAESHFIAPDGSYVNVHPDTEPTGHWFVEGEFVDGSYLDGGCADSKDAAMRVAQATLAAGKDAYERAGGLR